MRVVSWCLVNTSKVIKGAGCQHLCGSWRGSQGRRCTVSCSMLRVGLLSFFCRLAQNMQCGKRLLFFCPCRWNCAAGRCSAQWLQHEVLTVGTCTSNIQMFTACTAFPGVA
jgi:hypothetical protein